MSIYPYQLENYYIPNEAHWDRHHPVAQGTQEWKNLRIGSLGSSEAAAVFPSGISKTVEPYALKKKLNGEDIPVNSFMQYCFDEGSRMEPVLRKELEKITSSLIFETGVFKTTHQGITFNASLDGVLVQSHTGENRICITEFKYRIDPHNKGDCGWPREKGGERSYLGLTVWCQVQHQMWVSGIHSALVYAGGKDGSRRLWVVVYSPSYIDFWHPYVSRFYESILHNGETTRFPRGEKQKVEKKLRNYIQDTVTQVSLIQNVFHSNSSQSTAQNI